MKSITIFILSTALAVSFLFSCKKVKDKEKSFKNEDSISGVEHRLNPPVVEEVSQEVDNCFVKEDEERIMELLNKLVINCKNDNAVELTELLTKSFINKFSFFPCDLYLETKKFKSNPDFEINSPTENCNFLSVKFNYNFDIEDDGEIYSSEKSFMLYFIKTSEGKILIDSFGAAG